MVIKTVLPKDTKSRTAPTNFKFQTSNIKSETSDPKIKHQTSFILTFSYTCILMRKVEHIGIAVKSLTDSVPLFEKLLNTSCYKTEAVESEKVTTAFFQTGETKIELVESSSPDGVIAKFIEKKGEGLHHIAFDVADIYAEMKRLQSEGFTLLHETPKKGADNKLVCFLHPKGTNGVLIELCQDQF
jgi:methylmalonyl-CoA/ethylmalonyl-CoA epimerase